MECVSVGDDGVGCGRGSRLGGHGLMLEVEGGVGQRSFDRVLYLKRELG